jgi:hypothetical protein
LNSVCIYKNTDSVSISVNPISSEIPSEYKLWQNYPNPFNPATKIRIEIPGVSNRNNTTLKIYNLSGIEAGVLVNGYLNPGIYEFQWDASELASGVYYYQLISGNYRASKKMILVK